MPDFRNRRAFWLVALLLTILAGPGVLRSQEFSFQYFGMAQGLGNMSVLNLYQDRTGFLWLTTKNGIYRFDGERFEGYGPEQGIPMNAGTAFGEGPDGALLAGGDYGLYRLVRNRFQKLSGTFKSVSWRQGIAPDGRGDIYLGTDEGLIELVPDQNGGVYEEHHIPQPARVTGKAAWGVLIEGDEIWWGCGERLCHKDAKGIAVYGTKDDGLKDGAAKDGLVDAEWEAIQKDRSGNLWVRGRSPGEYVLLRGETKFKNLENGSTLKEFVYGAAFASDGRVLLPSASGIYLGNGKDWQHVDQAAGLEGTAYAALEDRQHRLWIGTASRGLAQWQGYGEWEKYSAASGLTSDVVFQITPLKGGSIWAGTDGGLFHGTLDHGRLTWKHFDPLGKTEVTSLVQLEDGTFFAGMGMHGLTHIDPRKGEVKWYGKVQGLGNKMVHALRFDRNKQLWVATDSGVYVADAPYQSYSQVCELGKGRFWSLAVAEDGAMWAGGEDGLFEYSERLIGQWTHADGLSNQEVSAVGIGPDGTVWTGYRFAGGIDRLVKTGTGMKIERGVQSATNNGTIYFLNFDSHGQLWAGTERGVQMFDGARWTHYGAEDGLAWNDCNPNGFAEAQDGAIWIGTGGGLAHFKPRPHQESVTHASVVFTALRTGRQDISGMENPSFAAYDNSLSARFAALNARRQNDVVFRYRLGGANTAWTETSQHQLQFAQLAPGTYRLEVEAQDEMGAWSVRGAAFPFTIRPPWYLSWWAILLYFVIPTTSGLLVLRLREIAARSRERELRQLVEEKTNDLKLVNEELEKLSYTDALTGLANRRDFDHGLTRECARLKRNGMNLSLVILDVDLFKALNDSAGHQWGDTCLAMLAVELARAARRPTDTAARYGGEEFVLLLPDTDSEGAFQVAEGARLAILGLQLKHPNSRISPWITISAGVATANPELWNTEKELLAAADRALYEAKRGGRNCVKIATQEEPQSVGRNLETTTA
jgi:diguanylate cyclase (GGDEF)-like protein